MCIYIHHRLLLWRCRVLHTLNVQIMDALGSGPTSFYTGFTVSIARQAYLDICNKCTMVTQKFQTQLFANIVDNVFGITFMMLSAFNTLMYDRTHTIRITLYYLYDSLIRALQMYFIIDACHTTVEQVQTIKYLCRTKLFYPLERGFPLNHIVQSRIYSIYWVHVNTLPCVTKVYEVDICTEIYVTPCTATTRHSVVTRDNHFNLADYDIIY